MGFANVDEEEISTILRSLVPVLDVPDISAERTSGVTGKNQYCWFSFISESERWNYIYHG